MERQRCVWFMTVLLLAVCNSANGEDRPISIGLKQSLVLSLPAKPSGPLTSIAWKHNNNLVADWVKDAVPLEYYGTFKDRTNLNTNTGYLEIKKMTKDDAGIYTVEVNNRVQDVRFNVKVFNRVPKPTVSVKPLACNPQVNPSCNLTCDGDTTDTGPVTYSWKMGDGDWKDSEKELTINNAEEIQHVKMFYCMMKNIVNEEESEPQQNPFFLNPDSSSGAGIAVGVVFLILAVAGAVVGYWKRKVIKKRFCPSGTPDKDGNGNGGKSPSGVPLSDKESPSSADAEAAVRLHPAE